MRVAGSRVGSHDTHIVWSGIEAGVKPKIYQKMKAVDSQEALPRNCIRENSCPRVVGLGDLSLLRGG